LRAYKIVNDIGGQYKTLFHGINRSRVLKRGRWLIAEKKIVKDGGENSTKYMSGFTVLLSLKVAMAYLKLFKDISTKQIIMVDVDGIVRKEHSRLPVYLADQIFIPESA